MSQENVDLVKRLYERFAQRGLEACLGFFDSEVIWVDLEGLPGAGRYRGHEGLREAFGRYYDAWEEVAFDPEQVIDAGDAVVVAHRWHTTGKASGIAIDALVWNVLWLRDGKVFRRLAFRTRDAAIKAAGLSE